MATKQEKAVPELVVKSIEDGFKKNILPQWKAIEKRTIRIGSNSRIVYL